MGQREVRQLT